MGRRNGLFQKLDAHPPKETWESPKIKHFFGCKGKEEWEFPKYLIIFSKKMGIPIFFTIFDIENWEFPFLKQFLEFPFFKVKI